MSKADIVTRANIRGARGITAADASIIEANLAAFSALPTRGVIGLRFNLQTREDMYASAVMVVTESAKNPSMMERGTPHDPRLGVVATNGTCEGCGMGADYCTGHRAVTPLYTHLAPPEKNLKVNLKHIVGLFCAGCGRLVLDDDLLRRYRKEHDREYGKMNDSDWHDMLLKILYEKSITMLCQNHKVLAEHKSGILYSLEPKTEPYGLASYVEGTVVREVKGAPSTHYPLEFYYACMERLSLEQLYFLGFADQNDQKYTLRGHPKAIIATDMPIIPICSRAPLVRDVASQTVFHPMTKAYNKIINEANMLKTAKDNLERERVSGAGSDLLTVLEEQVQSRINHLNNAFLENYEQNMKNVLSNKTNGFMRNESQGRVTSFIGRAPVIPDPRRRAGEVSVPRKAAEKLTVRVTVSLGNLAELSDLLRKGKVKFIHPHTATIEGTSVQVTNANRGNLSLQVGDEVSRDLQDGDYLLMLRQPVLGGLSLISNKVFLWDLSAYGFSQEEVAERAMDFDGDAVNGVAPQSMEAAAELRSINAAEQLLINAKNQLSVFGAHQEGILGSVIMTTNPLGLNDAITENKGWVTRALFDRITALVSDECNSDISMEGKLMGIKDKLPDFQRRLEKWGKFFSRQRLTEDGGEEEVVPTDVLLSWAFPSNTIFETKLVSIRDGIIIRGIVDINVVGRAQDTLLHNIAETDRYKAITVMKDIVIISTSFTSFHGMSAGWSDCAPVRDEAQKEIGMELASMMTRLESIEDPIDSIDARRYQNEMAAIISKSSGNIDRLILDGLDPNNRIMKIIRSGAKGTERHLYNIAGIIGQQYIAGKLPTRMMTGGTRYSWYFDADDKEPTSMGMCTSSLSDGVTPAEAIWQASAARMSFINLHLTTPDIGKKSNDMYRVLQGVITNIKGACTDGRRITTSLYGGDGMSPDRLRRMRQPSGHLEVRFCNLQSFADTLCAEEGWYQS
jgi:DNA-directed RNA polymerase beta' subunit